MVEYQTKHFLYSQIETNYIYIIFVYLILNLIKSSWKKKKKIVEQSEIAPRIMLTDSLFWNSSFQKLCHLK